MTRNMGRRLVPIVPATVDPQTKQALDDYGRFLSDEADEIKRELEGNLSWQNWSVHQLTITTPEADTPVTVPHALGKVPEMYSIKYRTPAKWYATEEDEASWSETTFTIRSDTAGARARVYIT